MLGSRQFSEGNSEDFTLIDELIPKDDNQCFCFYYSDIWQTVSRVHGPRGQHLVINRLEFFFLNIISLIHEYS